MAVSVKILDGPIETINKAVPLEIRRELARIVIDAYKWSDILIKNTAVFQSLRGRKRLLPEIKNVAVEFVAMQAVKNNRLPFQYRMASTSNHSHFYLELFDGNTLIHFNQVAQRNNCARKAFCRDRLIKPLSSYMDFDSGSIECDNKQYFQVNHGYQSVAPLFVTLGIPEKSGKLGPKIYLLDEYSASTGKYPKSKIETVKDFSYEDFQRYAEGEEGNELFKS
ncbi:MAG: hypothetical protein ABF629_15210 [Sporolactobacillus sp.]|uniref:hypothetical protein n=1 Tax=Sporolactobacillus sp. STSJ-5 TaxID=2965076 RepID=UPI0021066A60|nr:hypothetical protein [Sporolactobacillus sp. STSJ-5]MCQ2009283.1 hypothetical protein [Sporolactobacillus sp. STSJ-5]